MLKAIGSTNFYIHDYPKSVKTHTSPTNTFILSTLTTTGSRIWNNPIINFLGSVWKVISFFFLALVCWQSSKSLEHAKKNTSFLSNVRQKLLEHLNQIPSDKVLASRVIVTPGNHNPIVGEYREGYLPNFPIEILEKAMPPGSSILQLTGAHVDSINMITMEVFTYEQPRQGHVLIKIFSYQANSSGEIEAHTETKRVTTNEDPLSSNGRTTINELAGIQYRIEDDLA